MAILPIITIPDPVLRKQAAPVERVDAALLKLAEDMLATCMTRQASALPVRRSGFCGG